MSKTESSGGSEAGSICGVLVLDTYGHVVAFTPETAELLQLDAALLAGAKVNALPAPLAKLIQAPIKGSQAVTNREISLNDAAVLRVSLLPVKSELVVVLNRVSPAAFEPKMKRLDRLASLGTLSAGMAHEIKNGMVAIKTFVDLLVEKGQDAELNEVVGRELKRIDGIVTQMLRFATPRHAVFANVRAHEALDYSLRLLQHQIGGKMLSLKRNFRAETDVVHGDEAQLQQAFMNLILNAIEAMGANGVLGVSTETVGEKNARQLKITVQDTGVGIEPENLARLFEPFFTTKKNGTGLGLAISQRIALEHHGAITVRSKIGEGSAFSMLLPAGV
jgi:signal transduction histidine kinase